MPYVITTGTPWGVNLGARDKYAVTSRRAVATLEEARDWAYDRVIDAQGGPDDLRAFEASDATFDAKELPEAGGTLGPLPDGTVIEVAPVEWEALRQQFGPQMPHQLIDAYNAQQSSR